MNSRAIVALAALALALCASPDATLARGPASDGPPPAQARPAGLTVELEGTLEIQHEDRPDGSRYHYFLHSKSGRRPLRFASPPAQLLTGDRIRARGVQLGTTLAVDGAGSTVTLLAAAAPSSLGGQQTLVILVNFQDNPVEPYTLTYARDVVFGTTSSFFQENSYGQTWLVGDVVGWYTIPLASTNCDGFQIQDAARQAAMVAGVNLSNYTTFVYAFPTNSGCGYSGMAQIGGPGAWINGAQNMTLKVVGHELGHVFGLWHSHSLECGTTVTGSVISATYPPPAGTCYVYEYGDYFDIMGLGVSPSLPQAHLNAFQKERLGWLGGAIATVSTSGTYVLDTYESASGSNPKALKIAKSVDPQTGQPTWYYVEFRQAVGFDSPLSTYASNVLGGVLIRTGTGTNPDSSKLLDLTPASFSWAGDDWKDPALVVGQTFVDPEPGVTIAPVSIDSSRAAVSVTFSTSACTRANPTVALSPSQSQSVEAGAPVTYTVSVTNNDNLSCTASSFGLQVAVPGGWSAALAVPTLMLGPGASASTTLTVASPTSAATGFYTFSVTAANGIAPNYSASTSAMYGIACTRAKPTMTVSPSQSQEVPAGTPVTYTVSVTNNDAAGCAASSFGLQVTVPSGWTAPFAGSPLTINPGASASTTFTATSSASAAPGSYTLATTVTNGASGAYTAMRSAIYVVSPGLTVSVSTDRPSYSPGQTVRFTARANSAGSPVAGASVIVVVSDSDNNATSLTTTTDSSGVGVLKFRLKPKSPVGLYGVRANAAKTPLSGSAATSFTVR